MLNEQSNLWTTDQQVEQQLRSELGPKERLIWCGIPKQGVMFRAADTFMIPFSLLWGGFAIFWEASVFKANAPFFFRLWGVPFVAAGLYIIFGRFFVDAAQRRKILYGLTNERILIVSGLFNRNVKTLNLRTLSDISLTEKADKSGTIMLGPVNPMYGWMAGTAWPGMDRMAAPSFDLINDAKQVYEKIRHAQNDLNSPAL